MWPWGHLAVGYLAWSLWTRFAYRRPPRTGETLVVIVGTQVPDLVDKPLAWSFSVLPSGRSLAHSAFTLALVSVIAVRLSDRYDRPTLGVAFALAYASHLLSDAVAPVRDGEFYRLSYFLWPILPAPLAESEPIFVYVQSVSIGDFAGYHGIAILLCVAVWLLDGAPGVPWRPVVDEE